MTGRGRGAVPVAGAVIAGMGLAVQARLNGELGSRVGDGIAATLASTVVGLVLLLLVVPLSPTGRRGLRLMRTAVRAGDLRWWHLAGGSAIGGLVVDRFVIGPGGRRPVTVARAAGAAVCVVAVAVAGHGAWGGSGTVLVVLPVLAGAAVAVQSALNGRLGVIAGSPWPATLVNFAVAATSLAGVLTVRAVSSWGSPGRLPAEPLLYLAGVIGVGVIAVATITVRHIGVLVFGLASVAGQLLGAVVLDAFTPGRGPSVATFASIAITFLALALALATHSRFRRAERRYAPPES
ncbi:DMT family transporter [Amycolatopsis japonica]|uniref:DMT family transporter n=1 Tax=Amycolatopsis japonica TaxID=208439 RepID=UPI0034112900